MNKCKHIVHNCRLTQTTISEDDLITLFKYLLSIKCDLSQFDPISGFSPLVYACKLKYIKALKILLDSGVDTNKCTAWGDSILKFAVGDNLFEVVEFLLRYGVDVNTCDGTLHTPLSLAVFNGQKKYVELLFAYGADPNVFILENQLCLHFAVSKDNLSIANLLVEHGASPILCKENVPPPLIYAVKMGRVAILQSFLSYSFDNQVYFEDKTLLQYIAELDPHLSLSMARAVLSRGVNIHQPIISGDSPLFIAIRNNNINLVELLLSHGDSVNGVLPVVVEDIRICITPLFVACKFGFTDIAKLLLNYGALVDDCCSLVIDRGQPPNADAISLTDLIALAASDTPEDESETFNRDDDFVLSVNTRIRDMIAELHLHRVYCNCEASNEEVKKVEDIQVGEDKDCGVSVGVENDVKLGSKTESSEMEMKSMSDPLNSDISTTELLVNKYPTETTSLSPSPSSLLSLNLYPRPSRCQKTECLQRNEEIMSYAAAVVRNNVIGVSEFLKNYCFNSDDDDDSENSDESDESDNSDSESVSDSDDL